MYAVAHYFFLQQQDFHCNNGKRKWGAAYSWFSLLHLLSSVPWRSFFPPHCAQMLLQRQKSSHVPSSDFVSPCSCSSLMTSIKNQICSTAGHYCGLIVRRHVGVLLIPSGCAEGQLLLGSTAESERDNEAEKGSGDTFIFLYLYLYAVLHMSV